LPDSFLIRSGSNTYGEGASLPLLRANLPFSQLSSDRPSADTVSIAIMVRDAWPFAFAVNRAIIRRGKGQPLFTPTTEGDSEVGADKS
jgi:hypothetical protein